MSAAFTKGPLRFFEQLMQQRPGFVRHPVLTMEERGCRRCPHYDQQRQKCTREKCAVFGD